MNRPKFRWINLRNRLPESWKQNRVPGIPELNWQSLFSFYLRKADTEDVRMRAAYMSFNIMLAFFPAIIFFFTLVAYLPFEDAHKDVLLLLKNLMPDTAFKSISETLEDIVGKQRGGLLSFGFILAIYFSTSAIDSMIRSFHRSLKIRDKRSIVKKRLYSFLMNFLISLLLVLALGLITLGQGALSWLSDTGAVSKGIVLFLLNSFNWVLVIGLILVSVSLMYTYGPMNRRSWPFFSKGSIMATISILIMSVVLSLYVNNFNAYNKIYGSIGTLVVIMLWIYWNSLMILASFDLNILLDDLKQRGLRREELERKQRGNVKLDEA
ncbi:MAG: YihY/virulence factor BrkB family protein [Bacteroidetes bacterium]|nr:MAG: YihY/virulence factor BrkB family protein [Bacteroidota bacterium]